MILQSKVMLVLSVISYVDVQDSASRLHGGHVFGVHVPCTNISAPAIRLTNKYTCPACPPLHQHLRLYQKTETNVLVLHILPGTNNTDTAP